MDTIHTIQMIRNIDAYDNWDGPAMTGRSQLFSDG